MKKSTPKYPSLTTLDKQILVALHAIDGIGPITLHKIIAAQPTLGMSLPEIWVAASKLPQLFTGPSTISRLTQFKKKHSPVSYWQQLKAKELTPVLLGDRHYPPLLAELEQPPVILYCQGKSLAPLRQTLPIAVVGSRGITKYGRFVTQHFVKQLVEDGATIISGFMFGVDTCAHYAAVANQGQTVGVLGYGHNHIYPARLGPRKVELLAKGMLFISPFAPSTHATKGNFPARNRIVSAISLGVLVTEAAAKSGSHITANWAGEDGRAVFAVPGPITNPQSEGTRRLINQGAKLVTHSSQIWQELSLDQRPRPKNFHSIPTKPANNHAINPQLKQQHFNSQLEQLIFQLIAHKNPTTDQLALELQLPISHLNSTLSHLELRGLIKKNGLDWTVCYN